MRLSHLYGMHTPIRTSDSASADAPPLAPPTLPEPFLAKQSFAQGLMRFTAGSVA